MKPLLEIKDIKKYFSVKEGVFSSAGTVKAVDGVSLDIYKGETLGLVGESGCGKSTLARLVLNLVPPTSGDMFYDGENILQNKRGMKHLRKKMQIIFQDPFASLDPKMSVEEILAEPLIIHKITGHSDRKKEMELLLEMVGLPASALKRFPHEFSGGQRQRIGIARALSVRPEFIVADEPVSALDVSIQSQIINLLREIQKKLNLTYLLISHDLAVVRHTSDRIAVMYRGKIVEQAGSSDLFEHPLHPYTKALICAAPQADPKIEKEKQKIILPPESFESAQTGCLFAPRCNCVMDICGKEEPVLKEISKSHFAACHLYDK